MYIKRKIIAAVRLVFSVLFLGLIIYGQRTVSYASFGLMMLGLAGLLLILFLYNRSQVKGEPVNLINNVEDNAVGKPE